MDEIMPNEVSTTVSRVAYVELAFSPRRDMYAKNNWHPEDWCLFQLCQSGKNLMNDPAASDGELNPRPLQAD